MLKWLKKAFVGDVEEKARRQYQPLVDTVNSFEAEYEAMSDLDIRMKTDEFRARLDEGEMLDDLLPEAFAAVRESSRRTTSLRHYDVQILGGIVLHEGKIAEMKTGEGKTLVATLPLYLNALRGEGAHLVTVNDYLARRDAGWMGPVYHLLGMTVGFIGHEYSALFDPEYVDPESPLDDERLVHWRPCSRQEAYGADITYGTNNEFGFDYLRDNMERSFSRLRQRKHAYAIVDEVDNILIDEARTPLIISGQGEEPSEKYAEFASMLRKLKLKVGTHTPDEVQKGAPADGDVLIDLKNRSVILTEEGLEKVETELQDKENPLLPKGESIYEPQHSELTHYLQNALNAECIYHRDDQYIVNRGSVHIVDEFTGRVMPGRRWSDGLHQAIEAKENVTINPESTTYATITFQNYFRMYEKLAGMTGTAITESEEFFKIYELDVIVIPTNRPCIRQDHADIIYRSEEAKFRAIANDIRERAVEGQPILVGTTSVDTSERLSAILRQELSDLLEDNHSQVRLHVLNARQNADEAAIVAQAGQPGTITIATNMAGRGTDIILGGNPESLASRHIKDISFEREEIEQLSQAVFSGSEDKKTPEEIVKKSDGTLPDNLIQGLKDMKAEYDRALDDIDHRGEIAFLADAVFHDVPDLQEQKQEVAQMVLQGNFSRARRIVQEFEEMNETQVAEIQHLHNDCTHYRQLRHEGGNWPKFLAVKLFDRIYTARAKLVQLTLQGHLDQARELVENIPGLKPSYIDDILAIQEECEENHERVKDVGGLYVVGTERHEARRIDNQLRGRSGRQGDPGESRFYLSLEDDLMKRFGPMDKIRGIMDRFGEDMPIEAGMVSKSIEGAQTKVEGHNFDIRKNIVEYDDVKNKQREVIYTRRRRVLEEAKEQQRIEEILSHYRDVEHLINEVREEIEQTKIFPEHVAQQKIALLLPDVSFDIKALREANEEQEEHKIIDILRPLVREQQEKSIPVLADELDQILELPDDAEETLQEMDIQKAKEYIKELWREQRDGDLEDRIKNLFNTEFSNLVERYFDGYEVWITQRINEVVGNATNPATDVVDVRYVKRHLETVLPEVETLDEDELADVEPEELHEQLHALIPENVENGHNVRLLAEEIAKLFPLIADSAPLVVSPEISESILRQERDRYIANYFSGVEPLLAPLDEETRRDIREETDTVIRNLFGKVLSNVRLSKEARKKIAEEITDECVEGICDLLDALSELGDDVVIDTLNSAVNYHFDKWRIHISAQQLDNFQRTLMLQTIDREWQQYLTAMEDLRLRVGFEGIRQRKPIDEYRKQGFQMFNELLERIDHGVIHTFFHQLLRYQSYLRQAQEEQRRRELIAKGQQIQQQQVRTVRRETPKVGRNDPCPCGSGKKYKECCMRMGAAVVPAAAAVANSGQATTSAPSPTASGTSSQPTNRATAQPKPRGRAPAANNQRSSGASGGKGKKKKSKAKR